MVKEITTEELKERAKSLRKLSIEMVYHAQSGHPGGSLSSADVMANLYFREMNYRPEDPNWEDRDRFVLSKGHVAPVLYAALMEAGVVDKKYVTELRKLGSPFQGHPDSKKCPGVEISTGSLGQGISTAVGMALGLKRDGRDSRVYCLMGDGEMQEGQVWEAIQSAHSYSLDNFTVIIDVNLLQIDGFTWEVAPNLDFVKKLEAFGYNVYEVDGHDMQAISDAFDEIRRNRHGKPSALVMHTLKGKGVDYMEDKPGWHGKPPNDEEYADAMEQLEKGLDK